MKMNRKQYMKAVLKAKTEHINALKEEIREIVYEHTPEKYPTYYEIDTFWGCVKSPFGWCCYDHFKDRGHDNCIFCHEPQERK